LSAIGPLVGAFLAHHQIPKWAFGHRAFLIRDGFLNHLNHSKIFI
jgi:hypothetical protein